ncbi:MAG: exo-alpha-sialidase [Clostridia bacterium]|nr:exo-alpha-sialidase [Clostridia bacterium]
MKIIANEFVFPILTDKGCHASHFLVLQDGSIFCVCFCGTREGADDVRIIGIRRDAVTGRWGEPRPITEDDGQPHWNPVLFQRKDGVVILFYKVGRTIRDWKTRCMISYDGCKTFGESFEMVEGDDSGGRGPSRNKAIYLRDGSILAPGSTERGAWTCFFDRSFDEGRTWMRGKDICLPERFFDAANASQSHGIIQPTVWQSDFGVHALMRSGEGCLFRTDSPDGDDWCEPYPIDMPNNNSAVDLINLPDGRLILACNPFSEDRRVGARSPLSLYESTDNGKTFTFLTHLATMPGEYSYPAIRYENGHVYVTYTWRRRTIQFFCFSGI